jgi:gliding motility-associated-like protein
MLRTLILLFWSITALAQVPRTIEVRNNCITQCNNCTDAPAGTVFEIKDVYPATATYLWDFGEAGATSTARTGVYQYCNPGVKKVSLQVVSGGVTTVYGPQDVKIGALPEFILGNDQNDTTLMICKGDPVVLNAFAKVSKPAFPIGVSWFPKGQTSDTIQVTEAGCYSVMVTDIGSGCSVEAKMEVKICGEQPKAGGEDGWNFGTNASLIFSGGSSTPTARRGPLQTPAGVAKMTDENNDLIFYTNGSRVYSKDNSLVAQGLNGDTSLIQGVAILPKTTCKGCQSEYYIFTMSKNAAGENQLYYSIYDRKLNGGRGGVSVMNQFLSPAPSADRFAVSIGGGDYFWLQTQDINSNVLRTFKVSKAGISAPTVSNASSSATNITASSHFSRDGKVLAIAYVSPPSNQIDIYDFDVATGKSTFRYRIPLAGSPYGVEFSADARIVYASVQGSSTSQIWQYSIASNDSTQMQNSKSLLWSGPGKIGALQGDPSSGSIIYVAFQGSSSLGKIVNPDISLKDSTRTVRASFVRNGLNLAAGTTSGLGLPLSIVLTPKPSSTPSIQQSCDGTTYRFKVSQDLCDPIKNDRLDWKIYQSTLDPNRNEAGLLVPANPSSTLLYSYTGTEMSYEFKQAGDYVVTVAISNSCLTNYLLDASAYRIELLEPFVMPSSYTFICKQEGQIGPSAVPPVAAFTYTWSTGQSSRFIQVPNPSGKYTLEIKEDATGCSVKKETQVNFTTNTLTVKKSDGIICNDKPMQPYLVRLNPSPADLQVSWQANPGILSGGNSKDLQINRSGLYQFTLRDSDGCELKDSVKIEDKCDAILVTPTVFTPNGDGQNDVFEPTYNWNELNSTYPKSRTQLISLEVYNRWGELLYATKGPEFRWDGTYNGAKVPQETYAYIIRYQAIDYPEKGIQEKRGAIVVVY